MSKKSEPICYAAIEFSADGDAYESKTLHCTLPEGHTGKHETSGFALYDTQFNLTWETPDDPNP